jgi:1,6-anhydro-N-acetylmuramate kinase
MIQRGKHMRLAVESRATLGIRGQSVWEDLDGHVAPQLGIPRPIHLAHATGTETAGDFVRTDARADADHDAPILR